MDKKIYRFEVSRNNVKIDEIDFWVDEGTYFLTNDPSGRNTLTYREIEVNVANEFNDVYYSHSKDRFINVLITLSNESINAKKIIIDDENEKIESLNQLKI